MEGAPVYVYSFEVQADDLAGISTAINGKVADLVGGPCEIEILECQVREWSGKGYFANVVVKAEFPS